MRMGNFMVQIFLIAGLVAGMTDPAGAFLDNKFKQEVEKETTAVKLVREVQRGSYDVVTTEELKTWIDSGKDMEVCRRSRGPAGLAAGLPEWRYQ